MISGKLIRLTCQIRKCSITVTRSSWLSLKSFQTLHELSRWRTKQASLFSKPLEKLYTRAGWRCCFCTRTVVSSLPTSFFNAAWRRNRFTFQLDKIKKQNLPSPSDWSERFCRGSGDTSHSKTPRVTSTCFQIFTILQCNISSQNKTKSSPTAIAQPTRDCAPNRSSPSNGVVKLTL